MDISSALKTDILPQSTGFLPSVAPKKEPAAIVQATDSLTLSAQASILISADKQNDNSLSEAEIKTNSSDKKAAEKASSDESVRTGSTVADNGLSDDELLEVQALKRRDAEVKAHEQAHTAAAGSLAQGGASFDYQTGPDGKRYAVGGEVSIDTSAVAGDPQATLVKAQKIRRAATAPADPSAQDRSVAAEASRMEAEARSQMVQQGREKQGASLDEDSSEEDVFSSQSEKNIQDSYTKIQSLGVLQEQKSFVDLYI